MNRKDIGNDKLMRNIRNKLDMKIFDLVSYDPEFRFFKYDNEIKYNFYNYCKANREKSVYGVDFGFSITGEDEVDILRRYEKNNNTEDMTDDEVDEIIKNINDIKYVIINGLYIRPRYTGLGTKIVNMFIEELKKIEKLKSIYLIPKDTDAKRFWMKMGFREDMDFARPDNMIDYSMVYNIRK